jgi:uncharacterized protein (TIGR01777 family)
MPPIHFCDQQQNVLITGATGFIGQQLVAALLADGHRLTVLTRRPEQATRLFSRNVRCVANLQELSSTEQIDTIINLAGARILGWRWTARRKEVLRQSRIAVTQKIIDWVAQTAQKPKRMFSASAIGYYGIQAKDDDRPLKESSQPTPIFMSQLCEDWEIAARQAEVYGVHVIRMRFGLVLGHRGALPMMLLPIKLGFGGPLGDGKQWMSWIHIEDLIRGIAYLWQLDATDQLHDKSCDVFNFTAPQAVRQRQFNQMAAEVLHRPNWLPTPAILMRLVLGEQGDLLLEGQRVVPANLTALGFTFLYPELMPALKNIT